MIKNYFYLTLIAISIAACAPKEKVADNSKVQADAQKYLDNYNAEYQKLYYASAEGQWVLNTKIIEGDTTASHNAAIADEAYAKYTGSTANIDSAKKFIAEKDKLTPLQAKQFEAILFMAGNNPETAGDAVKKRIDATNKQVELLYGYKYMLNGKQVSTNDLDKILRDETDVKKRQSAWEASKEVGTTLKDGLAELRNQRNACVQPLGYSDFFAYQVSEYGMTTQEMRDLTQSLIQDVWPLYRELHTWARYELAAKYKQPVPDYIPAHWLPNRWGQDWTAMVNVEGLNIDPVLAEKGDKWVMETGEEFWVSMGFPELPQSFWDKSSLYPLPENAGYNKNNHASAWHMDLGADVRSLMSVEANTEWWSTVLHELGHIYYYIEYSNPDVPMVLRGGANRGFHEAFGSMIGLASLQKPLLESQGLIPAGVQSNDTLKMLSEALDFIVHIPWGSGVMTEFEYELYANNLPKDQYNAKWWELVKKYQGIVPPTDRGEMYCDAATKTHINDDAAQYYDYSISNVLLFQFHVYIANNILKQPPTATNYWGSKETGDFLRGVMKTGATEDWRDAMQTSIGSPMSAKPMVDYFAPLMEYLKKVNAGRTYTLPETI
ncbi:MAG: M2 family metallopeptidase [Chitinophagales bacterium]|nr:M2 family metallopeptidase [Chitinophagales bacterium]MBP8754820.1 M2 family metallopeptidase [Chitinophagales bacterium]MBP9190552.1 M2 family metallopeptidase [Chitinophagales bacterium]MBP9549800.1 M2 family metallopeptidase [Chitinophagales bacterium]MBP9705977.1 M2 family metallopeptidase [Chitinophagales bacterium]